MSDHEESASTSAPSDLTTPRRPNSQARARRSIPKIPEDEEKEVQRQYLETDHNLDKAAQALNLSAINVKSVISSVIKNPQSISRLLGTGMESAEGVRNTRSKTKSRQGPNARNIDMNVDVPIRTTRTFVDYPFEDEDEFDNDWRPDDEDSTDSSRIGSSEDESEHLSEAGEESNGEEEEDGDRTMVEVGEEQAEMGRERVRPTSAASQTLYALNAGDDEPSNDYREFLTNLNNEFIYNEEEDPDYEVEHNEIFNDDDDPATSYWDLTIPQREVEDIITDVVTTEDVLREITRNLSPPMQPAAAAATAASAERPAAADPVRLYPTILLAPPSDSAPSTSSSTIPRPSYSQPAAGRLIQMRMEERVVEKKKEGLVFTNYHRSQLRSQLEQHIQLLTQAYVGCYFEPLLFEQREAARAMIDELVVGWEQDESIRSIKLGAMSCMHSVNLAHALSTCDTMHELPMEKRIEPLRIEDLIISHTMLPITKAVLGESKALLYPSLVSHHRMTQGIGGSSGWSKNELMLYAMGLNRFSDVEEKKKAPGESKYALVSKNCMPWRNQNELRWQYNGMKRGMKRNGMTKHNENFFKIVDGTYFLPPTILARADVGLTMGDWPTDMQPAWYSNMKSKQLKKTREEEKRKEEERRGRGIEIERGDDEMERIVIVEEEEGEGEGVSSSCSEIDVVNIDPIVKKGRDQRSKKRKEEEEKEGDVTMKESSEEVETVRGEEGGEKKEGRKRGGEEKGPMDFSQLMIELSEAGPSKERTPPPPKRGRRSITPCEKTVLPPTPGKRSVPSPSEDSIAWYEMREGTMFDSPPRGHSSPIHSRIKTPGGTIDYVDSLMGYFGTPEKESEDEERGGGGKKSGGAFANLFGDFDFEASGDEDEEMSEAGHSSVVGSEARDEEREERRESQIVDGVKQRKKRLTRGEKERKGLEAIHCPLLRRRMMAALARKTAEDIQSRMNMHKSVFKQIQTVLSERIERGDRHEMISNLLPILAPAHKEVLYLLSVFAPPSSLPQSLILSQKRMMYASAMEVMCTIYAYLTQVQRKISYRQLMRTILEAHTIGGRDNVHRTLKEVLSNEPLLLNELSQYFNPALPAKIPGKWEMVDLRKGDEAMSVLRDAPRIERIDQCEILGGVPSKKMLASQGKTPSVLLPNNDGEPCLRRDGRYSEIVVVSDCQMEEERRKGEMEREEEKKRMMMEKRKERMREAKKVKMASRREEKARERKKEEEKREELERRKEEIPPLTHPFTREMDRALLMMYNEVERVTKRAVRKMNADIPYSANFTVDQLQARLNFLIQVATQS